MKLFRFLTIFFLFFLFPITTILAENTFTFSTEPQNIDLNTLSGSITIHAETSVLETTYITLNSSSLTGQFFSNKTSAEPVASGGYVYISTNNQNRTIYYKDSTEGDFVITANIFAKDKTTQLASITQNIHIGVSTTPNTSSTTTSEFINSISTTTNQVVAPIVISAHSSPASLSNTENKIEFEISAGRGRLTSVGNTLTFKVVPTKIQNIPESGISYFWSFGDGTTAQGNNVNHAYRFAGEYPVVVNAQFSDMQAVSRILVTVISPKISLARLVSGIEVINNSGAEINLEGWSLVSEKKEFVFPPDTLILKNGKTIFPDEITRIFDDSIRLLNPIKKEVAFTNSVNLNKSQDDQLVINELQTKIEDLKNRITKMQNTPSSNSLVKNNLEIATNMVVEKNINTATTSRINENGLNQSAIVFEAVKEKGFVNTIFSWPMRGFDFIKHLFVEE